MISPTETLLAIDGHHMAYRAYYAMGSSMQTDDGINIGVVHGFMSMMSSAVKICQPEYVAVAFDTKAPTFRHLEEPSYKANRDSPPADFIAQLEYLKNTLSVCQIASIEKDGIEADDILATLAREAKENGIRTVIASGDRDVFQLVSFPYVSVLYPSGRNSQNPILMNETDVVEKIGVLPEKYVEYAAMRGDTSDNLRGVDGVGEKTAAKLLTKYGNIETILKNAHEQTPKISESLSRSRDVLERNTKLMTLVENAELSVAVTDTKFVMPDMKKLEHHLAKLKFSDSKIKSVVDSLYGDIISKELLFSESSFDVNSNNPAEQNLNTINLNTEKDNTMTDTYSQDTYGQTENDDYYDDNGSYSDTQTQEETSSTPKKEWEDMSDAEKMEKLKDVSQNLWNRIQKLEREVSEISKQPKAASNFRENVDLGISPVPSDWQGRVGNWVKDKETGGLSVCVTEDSIYYPEMDFVHRIDDVDYVRVVVVSKQGKAVWCLIDTREDGPGRISSPFMGQYDINKGRQLVIVPRNMWLGVKCEATMLNLEELEAASQRDLAEPAVNAEEEPF